MFERVEESEGEGMDDCEIPGADLDEYEEGMGEEGKSEEGKSNDDIERGDDRRERRDGKKTSVDVDEDDDDDDEKEAGKDECETEGKAKGKDNSRKRTRVAAKEQTQNMRRSYERFDQTEMSNLRKGVEKFGFGEKLFAYVCAYSITTSVMLNIRFSFMTFLCSHRS